MGTEQQNQDKPVSLVINNKEEQLNNLNLEFKNDVPLPPSGKKKLEKISATRRTIAQVLATIGFGTLLFGIGLIFSMPTIVNGSLMKNKNDALYLDDNAASWFGSIIFISQPLGSVASGFLQDTFGRKQCMMMVNIPQVVGWIIIYFSTNIVHLYFAATVLGLSLGFMEAPALSYIGEITEPRLRGMLSSLSGSFAGFGILAELFIGALTDWRTTCAISATVPVLAFITIFLIPESPTWLIMQGRISEAEQALCWLRGWVHPVYVRKEFLALLNYANSPGVKEMTNMKSTSESQEKTQYKQDITPVKSSGILNRFALLLEPKLYRPLTMVLIYFFISHNVSLLGVRPVLVHIFETIGMPLKAKWVLVISGGLQITGALIGMFCMKWLGKRKVNFMSLLTAVICCYLLTITISIQGIVAWVPFALFCVLFFATGFGVVPLPWVLLSELFPLEGRGIAGGLAAALSYFLGFIVTKSYINLADWFGMNGAFSIYGTVGLVGLFYLYFCLPETEGKTLEEIEEFFKDKKDKKPPETSQLPNNTV